MEQSVPERRGQLCSRIQHSEYVTGVKVAYVKAGEGVTAEKWHLRRKQEIFSRAGIQKENERVKLERARADRNSYGIPCSDDILYRTDPLRKMEPQQNWK